MKEYKLTLNKYNETVCFIFSFEPETASKSMEMDKFAEEIFVSMLYNSKTASLIHSKISQNPFYVCL